MSTRRICQRPLSGSRPNAPCELDKLPATAAAALRRDLREGRKRFPGCQERIAERLGIEPDSVYKITTRPDMRLTLEHADAVIAETGGPFVRAHWDALAAGSPAIDGCPFDAAEGIADLLDRISAINRQVIADLSPSDDTPGTIDPSEARDNATRLAQIEAAARELRTRMEAIANE